ncbi:hypothetical protein MS3_00003078 [Schistosoma haematobium]|uniref:Uncharacterized protein n=1 Tax=Schistosoma haematobium TaxID=6185 RepID=A0A922S243_SCHHA|nr:hypothetical protein MS3_00003078 [Schistosoma haematobium]KAH9590360.1 hypothetical protein MS3_00003078 [Schistosoma haematobium]
MGWCLTKSLHGIVWLLSTYVIYEEDEISIGQLRDEYNSRLGNLAVKDTRKLLVFDHSCLRDIAHICWDHRVSNGEVTCRVLRNDGKSVDEVVNLHRLRWLGHVLRMPEHRLPPRVMLTSVGDG